MTGAPGCNASLREAEAEIAAGKAVPADVVLRELGQRSEGQGFTDGAAEAVWIVVAWSAQRGSGPELP
jgi:hypothetical protein